ncbi:MAG: LOG family protein [Candidatus Kapabacteria bacterium]|nr:LOG family protein [Candidatus Kapabacteria bacterium]MDW8224561.1 LOG family protein [Bacteroidota bacterium]
MSVVVCVFGSGRVGPESPTYYDAVRLGSLLGGAGFGVATGGYRGIMEAVLRGAASYPVRRVGVVTMDFGSRQANPFVDEVVVAQSYLERLQKLIELGAAYVAFPGGTGTLLELFALWALRERDLLPDRPIVCVGRPWVGVFEGLTAALPELTPARTIVRVALTPEEAFLYLQQAL